VTIKPSEWFITFTQNTKLLTQSKPKSGSHFKMLDLIIFKLACLCAVAFVYALFHGFMLIGFGFLDLSILGFWSIFEDKFFK